EGRAVAGQPILPRVDKITYTEVADDLRTFYRVTGRRNLREAEKRLRHLDRFFAAYRVAAIDPTAITRYVERRQQAKPANGTINRELAVLSRMLRLAYKHSKLMGVPVSDKLKEAAPRAGFFEQQQFDAVPQHLPVDLRVAARVGYTFGWRTQEVLSLDRRHL